MLLFRTYTRKELEQIFSTNRLDAIKRSLDRNGYIYATNGRGEELTLIITACTKPFTVFCKEELHYPPQTDFVKLKRFLKLLFFDEKFARLSYAEMEENCGITAATISNWIRHLVNENLLMLDIAEFIYYNSRRTEDYKHITEEITKEEYNAAWTAYWEGRLDGYFLSVKRMYNVNQGTPHKKNVIVENGLEMERLNKLKQLLEDDTSE